MPRYTVFDFQVNKSNPDSTEAAYFGERRLAFDSSVSILDLCSARTEFHQVHSQLELPPN